MTPIEMAEAMEGRAKVRRKITNRENTGDRLSDQLEQAATMLRQQQEEIEALKAGKIRAYDNGVEDGRKPNTHPVKEVILLTKAEIESGFTRVQWAEALIKQLPEEHEGRNSWLLNYGEEK